MDNNKLETFINTHIAEFHNSRIECLKKMQLDKVLKRKNPYLFKAKNINTCEELIRTVLDAYLSSQEETLFGSFLEKLAGYVCAETLGGYKSGIKGIDLEFNKDSSRYIVSIKSGPNWGNSSQIKDMKDDFIKAAKTLRTQNGALSVVAINGCCYGKNKNIDKGSYYKYCGQSFWELITSEKDFYTRIIEPVGFNAKKHNSTFSDEYAKVVNSFTREFALKYCLKDGSIDWNSIVKLVSAKQD